MVNKPAEIRELDKQILVFQRQLYRFYLTKIKKIGFTQDIPVEFFRKKYEQEIELLTRQFIEQVYFNRVETLKRKLLPRQARRSKAAALSDIFINNRDLEKLRDFVLLYAGGFFDSVGRLLSRQSTRDFDPRTGLATARTPYDEQAPFIRLARGAGYETYNAATAIKLGEVDPDRKIQYVTAEDERVCPICMPFHLRIFRLSQLDIIPSLPQHVNCRCYYKELIGR